MVLDGRIAESWPVTGPGFRLHLARHWAWNHRFALHDAGEDPLEAATGQADHGPAHRLWPAFARSQAPPYPPGTVHACYVPAHPPDTVAPDLTCVRLPAAHL